MLLAGLGGLGGYALTMLVRHTVGTLAALFAYVVGGEALIAALPGGRRPLEPLQQRVRLGPRRPPVLRREHPRFPGRPCNQEALLTLGGAATYLGVLLAVVAVVSVLLFRRRDIPRHRRTAPQPTGPSAGHGSVGAPHGRGVQWRA